MAHARLSIVDPDARAAQPMTDASGRCTVVFNGEIYNYNELRRELVGHPFCTESDTEVLLALYLKEGVSGFRRLRGMFSLALADEATSRVHLVRDAVGKKPLFAACWAGEWFFGSNLLAMVAAAGRNPGFHAEAIGCYRDRGFIQPTTSLLEGAFPLMPGEVVSIDWSNGSTERGRCEPEPDVVDPVPSDPHDSALHVRAKLELALRRRLHNNPEPTFLLSGGIDSTLLVMLAKKVCLEEGRPMRLFTLGSVVPLMNDEPYARYAAWRLGTSAQVLRLGVSRVGERVLRAIDCQDEPLAAGGYFAMFALVDAVARHGRVLVTGDGADEVFLGYGQSAAWRATDGDAADIGGALPPCGPALPRWMSPWGRRTATEVHLGHMFVKADRASAEQAVEVRCPFLDWDVMSLARRLPFGHLTHGGRSKGLLKDLLEGWPRWFLGRRKIGFAFNLRYLWFASNFEGLRELVDARAVEMLGERVPPRLRQRAARWRAKDIFMEFEEAWRIVVLSRFLARLSEAGRKSGVELG